jgi:GTP-binding protein Era
VFVGDSWQSVNESDVTLFMLDAAKLITQTEYFILQKLGQMERNQDKKLALVLNKIDIVRPRSKIAKIIEELSKVTEFDAVFPISALNQTGVDQLKVRIRA